MDSVILAGDLVLRLWTTADRAAVYDIIAASRTEFDSWLPRLVSDIEDFDIFVDRVVRAARDGQSWSYGVEADGTIVGQCSLHVKDNDSAEIGYWIRTDRAKEGITTRAIQALCNAAVDHGFATLFIHCDEGNAASAAVARKLGFTHVSTADLDPSLPGTSIQTGREMTWTITLAN